MKFKKSALSLLALCLSLGCSTNNAQGATAEEYTKILTRGIKGTRPIQNDAAQKDDGISSPEASPQVSLRLQFGMNSATLHSKAVAELKELATALEGKNLRNFIFSIEGHTCNLGSAVHNLELSKRRAYAVADYLTTYTNLSPEQFAVKWHGESVPAVDNTGESARRINRRVIIKNTLERTDVSLQGRPATLQIIRYRNGQQEIVSDGDKLSSSSNYFLSFNTDKKQYAYVCQKDSSENTILLFPSTKYLTKNNPIAPGMTYRIPGKNGHGFFLDETIGTEELALLALDMPVQDPLNVCATVFQGDTALQRGIGGVGGIKPQSNNLSVAASEKGIQLCEVVQGGRTRGLGGITNLGQGTSSSIDDGYPQDGNCQGFFLKRFFIHQ